MRKRGWCVSGSGAVVAVAMFALGACSQQPAEAVRSTEAADASATATCDVASIQSVGPDDTTIVSADRLETPVSHCKIDGYVTTNDPGPNHNNFRLQLPERDLWEGRYFFIGMGDRLATSQRTPRVRVAIRW